MKFKFNIKRELKIAAVIVVVFGLIAFTERMKRSVTLGDIHVKIVNMHENHFLDEEDILHLMQWNHENVRGVSLDKINFRQLENKIKKDPFIRQAEMYTDLKGNVMVNVELRRPMARMVRTDGPDGYIAEDGTIMPVSDKFTARVILISGAYMKNLLAVGNVFDLKEGQPLMEMLHIIREDEFWNAQIAQLDIDQKAKISILPQVGNENIQFGTPENLEVKFRKLKIYYKEILPRVGWNKYKRINLEYEGQIVAE